MTYKKTDDLFDLAIWMQSNREGVSLNDIAQHFQVSRRTAERMRDMIVWRFPQIVEETGENNTKRWHIPQGTLKDFISFNADEIAVLENAKNILKRERLTDQARILEKTINKIKSCIKPEVMRKILPDAEILTESELFVWRAGPKLNIDPSLIRTIKQAMLEGHQIKISYFHDNTQKTSYATLNPYGFLYGERNHYLVAHHADGFFGPEVHHFKLTHIKHVEIIPTALVIVPGFNLKKHAEQSFGAFHEKPFEVEWRFDREAATEAKHYLFHPTRWF